MEIIIFIFGMIIGSFLNVLIYRLPLSISLLKPKRSHCPNCNHQIKWFENIPLVSYIFLQGKCSSCKTSISIRYPIVEFISGVVTLMLFFELGFNINFAITLLLFYNLIVLSFIDFQYKAVPDYLLVIALITSFFITDFNFESALLFAGGFILLEFFITFYIQNIKSKMLNDISLKEQKALGEGDIPIVAIIGGLFGIKLGLVAIFTAAIFAILPALYYQIKKAEIETPFIPFLVLGLFCTYFFQDYLFSIIKWSI
jgi:leader peptidase (prepilin peptidase) / N-methyltransferase